MIERIDEKYEGRFKPRALAAERATRAKLEAKGSSAGQDRPMRKEANPQESEAQAEPAKQEAKRIRYNDRAGSNTRRRGVGRPHRKSEQGGQWEPPRSQTWKHEQGRMVRIRRGRDEAKWASMSQARRGLSVNSWDGKPRDKGSGGTRQTISGANYKAGG